MSQLPQQESNRLSKQKGRKSRASESVLIDCKKLAMAKHFTAAKSKNFTDIPLVPIVRTRNVHLNLTPQKMRARRASDSISTLIRPRPHPRTFDENNVGTKFIEKARKKVDLLNKEKRNLMKTPEKEEIEEYPISLPKISDYPVYDSMGHLIDC